MNDFGNESIPPIEYKHVKVGQNERERERELVHAGTTTPILIHTKGRLGCFAAALITKTVQGDRIVDLTHFDPTSTDQHIATLEQAIETHPPSDNRAAFLVSYLPPDSREAIALKTTLARFSPSIHTLTVSPKDIQPLDEYTKPGNIFLDQLVFIANQGQINGNDIVEVGGRKTWKLW